MHRDSLVRSTPFRLAVAFAVMVVVAFALTGIAVHKLVEWELRRYQDKTIRETYSVIADAYGDSDLQDMLEAVEMNVRATRGMDRIFEVTSADRRFLGGNVRDFDVPDGWSDIKGRAIGREPDLAYRVYAGMVDGNRVVVGTSQQENDSIQEILASSFAWATVLVAVLAVSGGAALAARVRRRFNAVGDTMHAVSRGRLSARIPSLGNGDDIDALARDINDALARLEHTVEGMRQVSADIAHDLKTPLNRLRLTIEEALDREAHGLSVGEALVEAAVEADRINETFEALLRISQIEAGSRKTRFGPVDLGAILEFLIEVYRDVADDAGQSLFFDRRAGAYPPLSGDRELLTQMFANLIENAIRHCPAGTTLTVKLQNDPQGLVARFEDDGPGIPEAEREKVFRRLYRLEKSRTSPGSGLGLSLVKAVADLHDAAIELNDMKPGLGVVIRFRPDPRVCAA
ncbi:sensor histidine kinase [Chelativorans salis]|uniref:histidine kinase n=1 Tax=Chelativorans salis TaxID=2978478 RepID=A0ABT2LXI1_9HYPH|nr:HAMP domain-containing sensor histidine kinase [Chelativorans sp. EGI FJ00035]MCT7378093.1 HAMP domain-containing histidine kinase [Chelativorans sp. EGI FJ00035]